MSEDEAVLPGYPFQDWFDTGSDRPRFVGLRQEEAEGLARDEALAMRVLELPVTGSVSWLADRRSDRLNLVVEGGRVIRAAVF